jgi:hypothetical protein
MISIECHAAPEREDFEFAERLTDDELGLVTRTPKPEELLSDIEEHLRDIGLYSDK